MEKLPAHKLQKLIDYKNKLKEESDRAYTLASVEDNPIQEAKYMEETRIKDRISNEINSIIYE